MSILVLYTLKLIITGSKLEGADYTETVSRLMRQQLPDIITLGITQYELKIFIY